MISAISWAPPLCVCKYNQVFEKRKGFIGLKSGKSKQMKKQTGYTPNFLYFRCLKQYFNQVRTIFFEIP